ncbi:TIM barrel protein [Streptomyces sp. NPDC050264]|uniref:sugar phosphate isomerase/epimerase and 4-hydroxyphenylpyruvate domain-containing protein n=1 Tax=Streptomyces sp. NPDC050264 TaxID=3155038 RepID=UPI00341F7F4B
MRTSIATVSLSGSLTEKLTAAARAGFDGVEIFENDLLASPLAPEEIRGLCADLGLGIDLYQPVRDIEAVPADVFARNLRRAEHKFRVAQRLGADTVLVCSSVSPQAVDDDVLAARQLRQLAERAADFGVRIAYEALAWGRHVNTYDHAWRIVEAADHPALGTCLDSFHILSRGHEPKDFEGIADIPGEKIFFLQLADAPLLAMDVLQWSRHYRCFPGQGDLDVAGLLRQVLRAGYAGPLSLEVFNDVFRQAEAGPTAVDALRSLLVVQEAVGEEAVGEGGLPPAVVPTGFAFAELVTPDVEPATALLAALGFTRTGRHRGKPVDLWEQGTARVLLNTGPGARRDGTVLAAVGLETPDPVAAARRAEALLAPVLPRRRSTGDVLLDAVAAPDGTELFFCATERPQLPSWTTDFAPTGEQPGDGAGIRGIDHLALAQPWHQFDEAALFHRGVLGLDAQPSVDLADPYGLLRSRAFTSADGAVRIALGVGPAPGDEHARAQHIALAADDVVAAARAFRAAGGHLLPMPANYYDDLAARFDFAPGELETYRELDILYDRDSHGAFRHCYTHTLGRVFFELTQRDTGYRGYGAQNAPVRLAAQHVSNS